MFKKYFYKIFHLNFAFIEDCSLAKLVKVKHKVDWTLNGLLVPVQFVVSENNSIVQTGINYCCYNL